MMEIVRVVAGIEIFRDAQNVLKQMLWNTVTLDSACDGYDIGKVSRSQ